ncbi:perlucin-like [Dreissena polymorpha]|uniref:perlucin-like n=1 Tax=Dreissena polymorpha TaxID=45954 RepID=UPI0022653F79|nr:perlucin-like [Dreissena polymorpha]
MAKIVNIIAIYISVAELVLQSVDACPNGWMEYHEKCYHFSHDTEPWELAQMICREMRANLVEIETAAENNFLTQEVVRRGGEFWIGASDLFIENEWLWSTSQQRISYANWAPNEPTNGGGNPEHGAGNENCAQIRAFDRKWNDDQCHVNNYYICEKGVEEAIVG